MHGMTMRLRGSALLFALALLSAVPLAGQAPFPADEDLEVMLRYLVEDGATPGIVFGIVEADGSRRVFVHGSGGPGSRPLGPRSVFEIGSINKTFTGTLLAQMVARGEVGLEDPVSEYLPEGVRVPSLNGREITLLDLATHRSGLPGLPDNFTPGDLANPYADYTVERLYEFLSEHELEREPGAEAEYSNLGFGLLGHALARVAGTTYRELVRERILDPLGMSMTGYEAGGEAGEWLTKGHAGDRVVPHWSATEAIHGAGGLLSSLEDMLTYVEANLGPPETELERAMREAHRVRRPFDEDEGIGLGWRTETVDGRRIVSHGGASAGYSARIAFDPERGVGFVRLANTGDYPDDLGIALLRAGGPLDVDEAEVPVAVLERYVGTYELGPDAHFFVRLEDDGHLSMQPGRRAIRLRLYPASDSSFFLKRVPRQVRFATSGSGSIEMVADMGGRDRTLPRVSDDTPPPGLPAAPDLLDLPVTPADIQRYEGSYTLQAPRRTLHARVFGDDGALMAQLVGGGTTRLLRQAEHTFVLEAEPQNRLVFRVEEGRATGVTLRLNGQDIPGRRQGPGEAPPPEPAPIRDLPVTAGDMARYEGTYRLEVGARTLELRIFPGDDRLLSQAAGQRVSPLRYQGDHVFVPDFDDRVRLVFTVTDGRATHVTLHQAGATFRGAREP